MVFLPIVERELRVASRRAGTHRIRLWTTAAALAVCSLFFLSAMVFNPRNLGPRLFQILTWYAFGLSLLGGVFLAADCISEEKREGTLGLLFLTDLKGYDVVLGKLMAVGLSALYGLVAVLPVTALPLLMGGVTGAEYWRVSLALVNTLFFALATGIFVSTGSREASRAMGNTLALLVIVIVVLPLLGVVFTLLGRPASLWYLRSISPFYPFNLGTAAGYYTRGQQYWLGLLSSNLFAWFLLLAASWRLPRAWQDKPLRQRRSAPSAMRSSVASVRSPMRRARLLDVNPILWLASDDRGILWRVWGIVAIALMVLAAIFSFDRSVWSVAGGSYVLVLLGFLLKVFVAFQASRFFVEARRNGALELILSTPLTGQEIVRGQWLALRRVFLWPVVIFLAAQLLVSVLSFTGLPQTITTSPGGATNTITSGGTNFSYRFTTTQVGAFNFGRYPIELFQLGMMLYGVARGLADMVAVGFMGMWLGLSAKKPSLAAGMTLLFVVVLPAFAFCLPNVAFDAFFIFWARHKLLTEFRTAAMPSYRAVYYPPTPLRTA